MWPTLEAGRPYRFLLKGSGRLKFAYLLAVGPAGELALAFPARSARGRWIPAEVARADVRGVFAPAGA